MFQTNLLTKLRMMNVKQRRNIESKDTIFLIIRWEAFVGVFFGTWISCVWWMIWSISRNLLSISHTLKNILSWPMRSSITSSRPFRVLISRERNEMWEWGRNDMLSVIGRKEILPDIGSTRLDFSSLLPITVLVWFTTPKRECCLLPLRRFVRISWIQLWIWK